MKTINQIWKFFVSVKLTVFLLISLAATSIIGTVIPQNASHEAYFRKYGAFLYRLYDVFDVFDMYHSWWFQLLLILLIINIVVCSIDRLSSTWKIAFPDHPSFRLSRFRKLNKNEQFSEMRSSEELLKIYRPFVSKKFGYHQIEKTENGFVIFAEKWRWTILGVYIVHASVVFIIVGAIIGSIFGFEGFVMLPEGESVDHVRLNNSGKIKSLGFSIRCDDYDESFYESGTPKEFRSSLTIFENNQPVQEKDIIVNDPLRYKGVNIFLNSRRELSPEKTSVSEFSTDEIFLNFYIKASGTVYKKNAEIGQPLDLPEGLGKFVLIRYIESADFMGQNIGSALLGILTPPSGEPSDILLPLHFPNFDKMRRGNIVISVADQKAKKFSLKENANTRFAVGLLVTKDPGIWFVYFGFLLMIIGFFITFFMFHQKLCIEVACKEKMSDVKVMGIANKNRMGMERAVEKIAKQLLTAEGNRTAS